MWHNHRASWFVGLTFANIYKLTMTRTLEVTSEKYKAFRNLTIKWRGRSGAVQVPHKHLRHFPSSWLGHIPYLPFLRSVDWFSFFKWGYKCWKLGLHFIYALEWYMTFMAPIYMELQMAQRHYVEICVYDFEPSRSRNMRKQWVEVHSHPYVKRDSYWASKFLQRCPLRDFIKTPKKRFNLWY